jgi:predicted GNAT superfamily acetyltransferase
MTTPAGTPQTDRVTDLREGTAPATTGVDAAVTAADAAARAAGVEVRELVTQHELSAVYRMYNDIWRPDPTNPPVTSELLRALSKAGNYIAGAFDRGELVGACVGFFGAPASNALHSHIAGVSGAARGRNVGFALKVHQRAWSMLHGVSKVAWTFDPLVRRNAYFNLVKLAACEGEYLTNFYGYMHDAINGRDDSDRMLVNWYLDAPPVVAACSGVPSPADADAERAAGAGIALAIRADGGPQLGPLDGDTVLVAVPDDIEAMRVRDPGCAKDWRLAVRDSLGALLAGGARVTGFDRSGWYVVRRGGAR